MAGSKSPRLVGCAGKKTHSIKGRQRAMSPRFNGEAELSDLLSIRHLSSLLLRSGELGCSAGGYSTPRYSAVHFDL